jgi:site-specific recombinase XerC
MAQPLIDLVDQFCAFQRKQRGKTEGGVRTYRWTLGQYLEFVASRRGRPACVGDLEPATIHGWMDSMAAADLALGTMRVRQSTLSSLCSFLVKRGHLDTNPVARLDRPPHRREAPRQVPLGHHGRSREGRSAAPASPRPGSLPDPSLLGHAT